MNAPISTATMHAPGAIRTTKNLMDFIHANGDNHVPLWVHKSKLPEIVQRYSEGGMVVPHPGLDPSISEPTLTDVSAWRESTYPPQPGRPTPQAGFNDHTDIMPPSPPQAGFDVDPIIQHPRHNKWPVLRRRPPGFMEMSVGGKVGGADRGDDSVPALLQPGEVVFNKKQLAGLKVGNPKLLRKDQINAIKI